MDLPQKNKWQGQQATVIKWNNRGIESPLDSNRFPIVNRLLSMSWLEKNTIDR